ncbi:hypothetical protein BYT27DRAFT_7262950, partial [Phlegmacium glaucopus]
MGRRKRATLASIDNLKKSKDENPTKRQKSNHPQPRPGKENANSAPIHGEGSSRDQWMDSDMPEPQLRGLEPVFQCDVLHTDHIPPERYFHEFQVNIGPDLEDLFDDTEGLPDLFDIEESDDESDSNEEDWEKEWYSDTEEGSFRAQGAQPETRNTSGRATSTASAPAEEERPGKEREAPLQPVAMQALEDLKQLLNPARKTGHGYLDPGLDCFVRSRLEGMRMMLNFYTHKQSLTYDAWAASSIQASLGLGKGLHCACRIRRLTRQFIKDHTVLPINPYGDWNESML